MNYSSMGGFKDDGMYSRTGPGYDDAQQDLGRVQGRGHGAGGERGKERVGDRLPGHLGYCGDGNGFPIYGSHRESYYSRGYRGIISKEGRGRAGLGGNVRGIRVPSGGGGGYGLRGREVRQGGEK